MATSLSDSGVQFADTSLQASAAANQIQTINSSVAASALTVTVGAGSLAFRNTNAAVGTIVTISVGALSIVVPSTATLGTVSAVASRLVILEAYNAGVPVACITNLAGGLQLDEANLISPTTISTASTSASIIYSASAVSAGSPYRVVGFIDITEATAGTWATAATNVQGTGGQALAALSSLGYGQTWQNVTASRAANITYTNSTGKPILVLIDFAVLSNVGSFYVNGSVVTRGGGSGSGITFEPSLSVIIQNGSNYLFDTGTIVRWWELR